MKKLPVLLLAALASLLSLPLFSQDLSLGPEDLRIEQRVDGGYHLFIRKKPGIASVLLTESTRDPSLQADNYAYRATEYNPVNGDELRLLDGRPIPKESRIWSLIDSSPEADEMFTEAFHVYIPYVVEYGYEWSRNGEVYVVDGTYLNIRAFQFPYADYRGSFSDNPFVLKVEQKPLEGPPEGNYMEDTVEAFTEIARTGNGNLVWSEGQEDILPKIRDILQESQGKSLDLVLVLDTTASMEDDIDPLRRMLVPMLNEMLASFASFRIGMVLYKDYFEEYLNKCIPFTADFNRFQRDLHAIRVGGGRDIPEAVYEALHEAAVKYPWTAEERIIILVGDAPPHPRQRGNISREQAEKEAADLNIRVHSLILPQ